MVVRVTGRKARGLQTEEIHCKCQTFFLVSQVARGNKIQVSDFFPFSMQNEKELSLKILCCHDNTRFHLTLTFLKP